MICMPLISRTEQGEKKSHRTIDREKYEKKLKHKSELTAPTLRGAKLEVEGSFTHNEYKKENGKPKGEDPPEFLDQYMRTFSAAALRRTHCIR